MFYSVLKFSCIKRVKIHQNKLKSVGLVTFCQLKTNIEKIKEGRSVAFFNLWAYIANLMAHSQSRPQPMNPDLVGP